MQPGQAQQRAETQQVRVTGQVQGVGYRYAAVHRASELGCTGWVRNLADGSVLVLVQGAPPSVALMLDWMRQGPPGAKVSAVAAQIIETDERFGHFAQQPTH